MEVVVRVPISKPRRRYTPGPGDHRRRPTKVVTRSRVETSIEGAMAATDLPDLNAPEFAAIKSQLARAYLDHKADIGAPHASDEAIVAQRGRHDRQQFRR